MLYIQVPLDFELVGLPLLESSSSNLRYPEQRGALINHLYYWFCKTLTFANFIFFVFCPTQQPLLQINLGKLAFLMKIYRRLSPQTVNQLFQGTIHLFLRAHELVYGTLQELIYLAWVPSYSLCPLPLDHRRSRLKCIRVWLCALKVAKVSRGACGIDLQRVVLSITPNFQGDITHTSKGVGLLKHLNSSWLIKAGLEDRLNSRARSLLPCILPLENVFLFHISPHHIGFQLVL